MKSKNKSWLVFKTTHFKLKKNKLEFLFLKTRLTLDSFWVYPFSADMLAGWVENKNIFDFYVIWIFKSNLGLLQRSKYQRVRVILKILCATVGSSNLLVLFTVNFLWKYEIWFPTHTALYAPTQPIPRKKNIFMKCALNPLKLNCPRT